jgi:putative ABC transport system substrate-binding protein
VAPPSKNPSSKKGGPAGGGANASSHKTTRTKSEALLAGRAAVAARPLPIVFGVGEDPVKLGLVTILARPGGNATGINFFVQEVTSKRLALLHELVPKAARIAVLVNPATALGTETTLREAQGAARARAVKSM